MQNKKNIILWLFFSVIFYFIFFYQLGSMQLLDFDESRVAKSSYEMSKSGKLIVIEYGGIPDLWSTKPALFHWIQSLFIKIFGLSELSVRLPNALAGVILSVLIFGFVTKHLNRKEIAVFAVLFFVTSPAIVFYDHSFRTADYDAILTLFMFLSATQLFLYLQDVQQKKRLYYFFLFFSLSVLTKGISPAFFLPGYLIYILIQKQLVPLLKNKHFYFGLLGFIVFVGSYFVLREIKNPGYLKALNEMEIMGRFRNTGAFAIYDKADPWANFFQFINIRFNNFYLLIPCGILLGLFSKTEIIKRFTLFAFLISFSLYFIISYSSSTNYWYDLPIYPFVTILVAIPAYVIYEVVSSTIKNNDLLNKRTLLGCLIFLIFSMPFSRALSEVYAPTPTKGIYWRNFNILQNMFNANKVKDGYIIALEREKNLSQSQSFYIDKLREDKNINIVARYEYEYNPGETLIAITPGVQEFIKSYYNCILIDTYYEIEIYKVISKKQG